MGDKAKVLNELAEYWAKAELDGDVSSLEEILADDFVAVGPRGFVLTEEQWIARHETRRKYLGGALLPPISRQCRPKIISSY